MLLLINIKNIEYERLPSRSLPIKVLLILNAGTGYFNINDRLLLKKRFVT